MLFLSMIDGNKTTLLLGGTGGLINGRDTMLFSWLVDGSATYVQRRISVCGQTDQWQQHDAFSWYDQQRQHDTTSLGWLMVGGNTGNLLGVTDKS
jgi:hypothetical protein